MKALLILIAMSFNLSFASEAPKSPYGSTGGITGGSGQGIYGGLAGGSGAGLGFCTPNHDETRCETLDGRVYRIEPSTNLTGRSILKEIKEESGQKKKNKSAASAQ